MGDFDRKFIVKEAESIVRECSLKDSKVHKDNILLKRKNTKLKKIIIKLSLVVFTLLISLIIALIY